jgi:endo-1,4-beta-D-glucanase Y
MLLVPCPRGSGLPAGLRQRSGRIGVVALLAPLALLAGCTASDSTDTGLGGAGGRATGIAGAAGPAGAGGASGSPGAAGTTGAAGTAGAAGTTGAAGAAGTTGAAGTAGGTGAAGTTGVAGTTGAAGASGAAGGGGPSGAGGRGGVTGTAGAGVAGGGGATSTGGTGGAKAGATTCGTAPPSPPSGGAAFPFPQHRAAGACFFPPSCTDDDMMAGWVAYKAALIVPDSSNDGALRVKRPSDGNDTVSEGISYGMLFSVYMNDKTTFDGIWKYEQKHLDAKGLMNWHIASNDTTASGGQNSATDADEDMAFALVMADKQWGGYTATANDMLTKVAANDFGTDGTIKGGDTYVAVNPSYLAPAFYRVFAAYTSGDARTRWMTILDKSYELLAAAANATTGLVPDWSAGRTGATNYTYDATRTPYRIALDYCWSGEPRAKAYSDKIGAFFAGVGAANIKDGYNLNGTAIGMYHNATFVGPAGAAGVAANLPTLVNDVYTYVVGEAKGSMTNYYDRSWALFTVMLMTGTFNNLAGL